MLWLQRIWGHADASRQMIFRKEGLLMESLMPSYLQGRAKQFKQVWIYPPYFCPLTEAANAQPNRIFLTELSKAFSARPCTGLRKDPEMLRTYFDINISPGYLSIRPDTVVDARHLTQKVQSPSSCVCVSPPSASSFLTPRIFPFPEDQPTQESNNYTRQ